MDWNDNEDDEGRQATFEMACIFVGPETEGAILVEDPVTNIQHWIPFSQVEEIHREGKTNLGTIVMTEWVAKKKGLCK